MSTLRDSFLCIGGYRWIAQRVFWGKPSRGKSGCMNGYDSTHTSQARPSSEEIARKTIDFWRVECVYALHEGNSLVYVGQGILGDRIKRHSQDIMKVGMWDTFTWLSPWRIDDDGQSQPQLVPWTEEDHLSVECKRLVGLIETAAIILSAPVGNRQVPGDQGRIHWVTQVADHRADGTLEDKVSRLLALQVETKQT